MFKNLEKIERIRMDSKKAMSSFEIKKRIGRLIIYGTIFFFLIKC